MSELKILPSALREKKRYIVFEVISKEKVPFSDLVNSIWHSAISFLGELGASKTKLWVIKNLWNEQKQKGIIRCAHTEVERIRASLTLVDKVNDVPVIIKVIGISGTIKSAKKKFFGERDLMNFAK